jgi:hypothetical protein
MNNGRITQKTAGLSQVFLQSSPVRGEGQADADERSGLPGGQQAIISITPTADQEEQL